MTYRVSESFTEGKLDKEERVSDDMEFHQAVKVFVISIVMSSQREELFKETSSTRYSKTSSVFVNIADTKKKQMIAVEIPDVQV